MKKYKYIGLLLLAASILSITSCEEESVFVNPLQKTKFLSRFKFSQNAGKDEKLASLGDEDPKSYDDTINLDSFIYTSSLGDIKGFVENNKVTIEDAIRTDVAETDGGYKIVALGDEFMKNNKDITSVNLGKYINSIGAYAFSGDTSLNEINLDSLTNLKYVGDGAFDSTPFYSSYITNKTGAIIFGDTLYDYIGDVSSYVVPSNIKYIAANAFKDTNLKSITFPSTLEGIGASAFENTSITNVDIPSTLNRIGNRAFANCSALKSCVFNGTNIEYGVDVFKETKNVETFAYDGNKLLSELFSDTDGLDKLTKLKVFGNKDKVVIDSAISAAINVTSLDINEVEYIGSDNLANLTKLNELKNYSSLQYISKLSLSSLTCPWYSSLADGKVILGKFLAGFKGKIPADYQIPYSVYGVGDKCFSGYSYTISIPNTVKYVGSEAFAGCNISYVNLPTSVFIGENAFSGCSHITEIELGDNTEISKNAFKLCSNAVKLALPYGDDLTDIFGDNVPEIKSYNFKNGPTVVTSKMFYNMTSLVEVTFSLSITEIGIQAFYGCKGIKDVDFTINIKSIGSRAFQGCTGLESVIFDTIIDTKDTTKVSYLGVNNIGSFCFEGCTSLNEKFVLPKSIRSVKGCVFSNSGVKKIDIEVLDYYLDGVFDVTNIRDDQKWIELSKDWNVDYLQEDEFGNPFTIPYEIIIVKTR